MRRTLTCWIPTLDEVVLRHDVSHRQAVIDKLTIDAASIGLPADCVEFRRIHTGALIDLEKRPLPTTNQPPLSPAEQAFELAARCAYEATRALYAQIGDLRPKPWEDTPEEQRRSVLRRVEAVARGETDSQLHESWMRDKLAAGWVFGFEMRPNATPPTHPLLVPYDQLPIKHQLKDGLFHKVVCAVLSQFLKLAPDGTFTIP